MPVRAFLFDFDGLLIDTETASRAGWQWLFAEHGHELPSEKWALMVGTVDGWDIWSALEELHGAPLERETLNDRRYAHELALLEAEGLRPGVLEYLAAADRLGIERAIVSSGARPWIDGHLERLGLTEGWAAIVSADHDPVRAKPRPTLYLEALEKLGVAADEAIAFEDSPNGILAAKAAGIYVVAVPNEVTRDLDVSAADLIVESLADLPPHDLLASIGA